eukprot:2140705-Karenia_brevis.AAC.1
MAPHAASAQPTHKLRRRPPAAHHIKQWRHMLPLPTIFASRDGCAEADHIGRHVPAAAHLIKQWRHTLPLPTLFAS